MGLSQMDPAGTPYVDPDMMRAAAFAYAADLRSRGYEDVTVYTFHTDADNRPQEYRNHKVAHGYAVRYTSSRAIDAQVWQGSDGQRKGWPMPKFHDRSLTVFCGAPGGWPMFLQQDDLVDNGVIADIYGEDVTPMWAGSWSPSDGPHAPAVPNVILQRFKAHTDGDSYPWSIGPRRYYHLIMTPATVDVSADTSETE